MNYEKHYENLILKAKSRVLDSYKEKHHVIPRCLGGNDDIDNIVELLPEEHYIAHLLLVKMYPDESKLIYAANMMANRNNKSYGWIKRKFAIQNSIDHKGMKHTEETRNKMKKAIEDRWKNNKEGFSEEQRRRAARPKNKKDGYYKPKSKKHAENIAAAAKKRPKYPCDICGKLITKANIENHRKVHNVIQCI